MSAFLELKRGIRNLAGSSALFGIAALGVAMGITAAMLAIIDGSLLRGFPLPEPDRLVAVEQRNPGGRGGVPYGLIRIWSERATTLEHVVPWFEAGTVFSGDGRAAEMYMGAYVGEGFFETAGVPPALGRVLGREEQKPGAERTVVLSHDLWRKRFESDAGVVGRTISIGGDLAVILGVMPPGFAFPRRQEFWLPLGNLVFKTSDDSLHVLGRLAEGRDIEAARSEFQTIAASLARSKRVTRSKEADQPEESRIEVRPLIAALAEGESSPVWWMTAAAFGVLLIGCINVANLLVARQAARRKEGAIRWSLGGGTWQLLRPALVEAFLFSALGGALGLGLAQLVVAGYNSTGGFVQAYWVDVKISPFVLLAIAALVLATTLLVSLLPALFLNRERDTGLLRDQGRGSVGSRGGNSTGWTLTIQIALACSLLFGTLMMAHSISKIESIDFGEDPESLWSTQVPVAGPRFPTGDSWIEVINGLLAKLKELPGVQEAAFTSSLTTQPTRKMGFRRLGQEAVPSEELPAARWSVISPDFFSTLGRPILQGRDFEGSDTRDAPRVLIVNRAMADRFFPKVNPVGQRIQLEDPKFDRARFTIVGVCSNLYLNQDWFDREIGESVDPGFYLPVSQNPEPGGHLVLRTKVRTTELEKRVKDLLAQYSPDMLAMNPKALATRIEELTEQRRMIAKVFGLFGFAAIFLTACGIFASISFLASQKKSSLALRVVFGASKRHILGAVSGAVGVYIGVGLLASIAGGYVLSRVFASLLYGVKGLGVLDFVLVLALVSVITVLAAFVPVRESLRLEPGEVLRNE
jgi:predicted permease